MKQCKNCGATIHEGDTFCRTCAMSVSDMHFTNDNNVATNDFIAPSSVEKPNSTKIVYKKEGQSFSDRIKDRIGLPDAPVQDNKQYIERDGNDRTRATLFNFLGLAALVVGLILLFLFAKNTIF